ncbi:MAG TPA: hypothetical protein VMU93_06320 [Caulobacteraceae bacterium]|nr:hypothetical protein [Caulobacteraceae bacterium]
MVLTAGAPPAAAPAVDLFYQRSVMMAAGSVCRLFDAPLSAALAASKAQARGAALRSGVDGATLNRVEARAATVARGEGCASPQLAAAAAAVRSAFAGYANLDQMSFPGELQGWLAQRAPDDGSGRWRVSQRARFGWDVMVFGLVGKGPDRMLMAVANFADAARPYGARLLLRDAALTDGPYLDFRQADLSGRIPLQARLPPRSEASVFNAEAMSRAGRDIRPPDLARAWAFRFPMAAARALGALDPREAVAVEFLFAGEPRRTAYVEVGDFDAARAFAAVAQR